MQIKITVDATPEEVRRFFGLPDVSPLQQEMIEKIREKMKEGEAAFDPLTMMRPYLTPNASALEAMQKAFWESVTGTSRGASSKK